MPSPEPIDPSRLLTDESVLWELLARAAKAGPPVGFKSLTLATIGIDGSPQARTIILREVDAAARTLGFHADSTSAKCDELGRNPSAALVGWDAEAKLQLRIAATISRHFADAVAHEMWARQSTSSLDVYRQLRRSGEPAPSAPPRGDEPQLFRFAALIAGVRSIEALHLGVPGQLRCRWTFDGPSAKCVRLVP